MSADDRRVQPTSTSTARAVPAAPDPERVRAKLTLALGDDAVDIWADACRAVGVESDDVIDVETLIAVLEELTGRDGVVSIVALSQLIRCRTTTRLHHEQQESR